jgi:Flp pilus assembly protein TadD
LIEQGDNYLSEDQFDRAIATYKKAVNSSPSNAAAHQRLGKAMSLAGNLVVAEQEMRKSIQLDPSDALAHSNLGMILGMQKKYVEAVTEERLAIGLDSNDAFAYRTMGSALASLGYYDDAITSFQQAIHLEPGNLNSYMNLGATLGRKGDFTNAVVAYRDAVSINERSVAARLGLGAALGKIGDPKGQIEQYRKAASLAPASDNAHGRLGWALYRAGDFQGAIREGCITNWLRLYKHGPEYLQSFLSFWAAIFLLFGLLFAALIFGSAFKPLEGEQVVKSYFLTLYKDRPGRFVITNRRLVFVPEMFSRSFGSAVVSIPRDQVETVESKATGGGGTLILETKDGTAYEFRIPLLVLKPLMESLSEATEQPKAPVRSAGATQTAERMTKLAKITGEIRLPDALREIREAEARKKEFPPEAL